MSTESTDYSEELPESCPPPAAAEPQGIEVFRLIKEDPAKEADFHSHRELFPDKKFNVSECISRSLSIFTSVEDCTALKGLPAHKDKKIAKLNLPPSAGKVMSTGRTLSHLSWWPYSDFHPHLESETIE